MIHNITELKDFVKTKIGHISAETFGWLAAIVLHSSTVPSLLAVMAGLLITVVTYTQKGNHEKGNSSRHFGSSYHWLFVNERYSRS